MSTAASKPATSGGTLPEASARIDPQAKGYRFVFVGGLHRSGTSVLYKLLGTDPRISTFSNTGAVEDEGQFLQTVYPEDNAYGGPGRFGLDPAAHLTETAPLIAAARQRLFHEWKPYWDLQRPLLAEKSPANLIRSRFLQEVFPDARFVFMMRHPIAAVLATSKWTGAYVTTLIRHWIRCHELLHEDLGHLHHAVVLNYETFTERPAEFLPRLGAVLDIPEPQFDTSAIKPGLNTRYFERWRAGEFHLKKAAWWKKSLKRLRNIREVSQIERRFEPEIRKFGYSFQQPNGFDC